MFMATNISSSADDPQSPNTGVFPSEGETGELVRALQKIVQHVAPLLELEIDDCAVALLDADRNTLVPLVALQKQGRKLRHIHFQEGTGMASWVVEHREVLVSNDVAFDPRFKHMGQTRAGSLASMPLMDQGNFIGTLVVSSPEKNAFSPRSMQLLACLAEQAALMITSIRQAELARQEVTRMKATFLSMITHELRAPLNTINGYLDITLEGMAGELNEQQREFVQRARAGSEHLYALVEDLLLISRADAGQLRLNIDLVSLREIVVKAVEELELIAKDNGITTRIDIASDFPSIYADAVRMQQVLRNLISNAIRYTPPGGDVTISARVINKVSDIVSAESSVTREDQRLIEVQVQDTGYGISPEYQERIFERFYQVPVANAGRFGGQGLGLAIVRMIVELHGGQVTVESIPSAGCTFKVTLPHIC